MKGKGKQFVPHGKRVVLEFPGGAGYGSPQDRDLELVKRDLSRGYISVRTAKEVYGLSENDIESVEALIELGDIN